MKNTELTKSLINSNKMTLAQARTTLDLTRHLVGELWEQKVNFLHSLLAKFYKQAFRSEKKRYFSYGYTQMCIFKLY